MRIEAGTEAVDEGHRTEARRGACTGAVRAQALLDCAQDQALLEFYISEGLRRDETRFLFAPEQRLVQALKKRGIPAKVLDQARNDLTT